MSSGMLASHLGLQRVCPLLRQRLLRSGRVLAPFGSKPCRLPSRTWTRAQKQGGLGDDDVDVAVFRFTLGIPGFEDRFIPRVVGAAVGVLLVANHILGAQPTPDAQLRSEWLGALLAVLCFFVPDIEERLREAMPGRGRQKTADNIDGATNGFFLDPSLPDSAKKELAWASFSLLKNTNCCGLLLAAGDRVVMARGALGSRMVTPGDAAASLAAMTEDLARSSSTSTSKLSEVASGSLPQLWVPELGALGSSLLGGGAGGAGANQAPAAVPAGAQSLLAQHVPLPGGRPGVLVVFSERPRALSERERGWVASVAEKMAAFV